MSIKAESIKAENYLEYLDKEMTILGVLSTFCLAIPALMLERILSADEKSLAYDFLDKLWFNGAWYLVTACCLMLLGAAFFYTQRSRLAWYYGQIALEIALPNYTKHRLAEWLKNADSWITWIPYHNARFTGIVATFAFVLSVASIYLPFIHDYRLYFLIAILVSFVLMLALIKINSERFPFEENIRFFRIF
jgi:hypothetical protein